MVDEDFDDAAANPTDGDPDYLPELDYLGGPHAPVGAPAACGVCHVPWPCGEVTP